MNKRHRAIFLARAALFAAILAVVCPFVIPIGAIGITAASAVLLFFALTVKPAEAITATALYLTLGAVGLPVFSYFTGGFAAFTSPSGGFLIGYLPFVAIASGVANRAPSATRAILAVSLSHVALYAVGTVFFILTTNTSLPEALTLCVLPFLLPDAVKAVLAVSLSRLTRARLSR